ncbi:hypothetical protein Tco_1236102 [Tanacetum coccineum]
MIHGRVMASKPKAMQDAIEFATKLMDKKISTLAERQAENKRKLDNNNQAQQKPPKKQGVAIAYTVGSGEGRSMLELYRCATNASFITMASALLHSVIIVKHFLLYSDYHSLEVMDAPTIPISAEENLGDPIDNKVDIIHPEPVAAIAFPAAAVVRIQAQHGEAIRGIQEHLLGVPIQEELTALRFRVDITEAENASLHARIKTTAAIEKITRNHERQVRNKMEQQLAAVQESQRQDRENFRKLQEKERIKPLRVRALVMTIGLDLPKQILNAQTEAQKLDNLKHKDVGVVRFGKWGKLNPRYVGPFQVLAKVGAIAYKLELPQELSKVHNTSHVSNLKKCYADEPLAVPLDGLHIDDKLHFVEEQVEIIDQRQTVIS